LAGQGLPEGLLAGNGTFLFFAVRST